ncbi:hypothetical protein JYU12_02050 [bacterium AH-315-K03]|nr:hypothetical protein [bacterium AH-315-K03]
MHKFFTKQLALALSIFMCSYAVAGSDESWKYGVSTGIFGLNLEGDLGFNTAAGPISSEFDLGFDDILDLQESAAGLSGFVSKGKWTVQLGAAVLELSENINGTILASDTPFSVAATYERSSAFVTLVYQFAKKGNHTFSALSGFRYTNHDIDFDVIVGPATVARNIEENWVDAYVGGIYTYTVTPALRWNTKVDVGSGGSEYSATVNTGLSYVITPSWVTSLYANYYTVDYESEDRGDSDWYLYEADEFGIGLGISFIW